MRKWLTTRHRIAPGRLLLLLLAWMLLVLAGCLLVLQWATPAPAPAIPRRTRPPLLGGASV